MTIKIMPYSTIRIILGEKRIETELHLFNKVAVYVWRGKKNTDGVFIDTAKYIRRTARTIVFKMDRGPEFRIYERDGIFDGLNLPGIWGKSGCYLDRCD